MNCVDQVGWIVGWLNILGIVPFIALNVLEVGLLREYLAIFFKILGQVAGLSSTEFGLAKMIWAAVVIGRDGNFEVTQVSIHFLTY